MLAGKPSFKCLGREVATNPCEELVIAIFLQALQDCKLPDYHDEIRAFYKSAWCRQLLGGCVDAEFIARQFEREIERPHKRIKK